MCINKDTIAQIVLTIWLISVGCLGGIFDDDTDIMSLLREYRFNDIEIMINKELSLIDKEPTQYSSPILYKLKLYYLLSNCYYYEQEDKVIESLELVFNTLPLLDVEQDRKELSNFILSFNWFYRNVLNYPEHAEDYFGTKKDIYLRIYQLRAKIALYLNDFHIASQLKRELISFNSFVLKNSHTKELNEIHELLNQVMADTTRVRIISPRD